MVFKRHRFVRPVISPNCIGGGGCPTKKSRENDFKNKVATLAMKAHLKLGRSVTGSKLFCTEPYLENVLPESSRLFNFPTSLCVSGIFISLKFLLQINNKRSRRFFEVNLRHITSNGCILEQGMCVVTAPFFG